MKPAKPIIGYVVNYKSKCAYLIWFYEKRNVGEGRWIWRKNFDLTCPIGQLQLHLRKVAVKAELICLGQGSSNMTHKPANSR